MPSHREIVPCLNHLALNIWRHSRTVRRFQASSSGVFRSADRQTPLVRLVTSQAEESYSCASDASDTIFLASQEHGLLSGARPWNSLAHPIAHLGTNWLLDHVGLISFGRLPVRSVPVEQINSVKSANIYNYIYKYIYACIYLESCSMRFSYMQNRKKRLLRTLLHILIQ